MNFTIDSKEYEIKFGFRVCRELKKIIGTLDLENEALVDVVYEKGAKLVQTAIKLNKLSPIPSIDKIEDYFDEEPGFGTDFLIATMQAIGLHVTPQRLDELNDAAKGN